MAVSLTNLSASRAQLAATYGTRTAPVWRYDERALYLALRRLGVRERVRIYLSESKRGRWAGSHHWDPRESEHVIMVARRLSPERASRVLWHELTHASQKERGEKLGTGLSSSAKARLARESYLELPGEREAHENERLHDELALVVPA